MARAKGTMKVKMIPGKRIKELAANAPPEMQEWFTQNNFYGKSYQEVKWQVENLSTKRRRSGTKSGPKTREVLRSFVLYVGGTLVSRPIRKADTIILDVAGQTMKRFYHWVADNFMDGAGGIGGLTSDARKALVEAGVTWKPLNVQYVKWKMEHEDRVDPVIGPKGGRGKRGSVERSGTWGNPNFWRGSGELFRQFESVRGDLARRDQLKPLKSDIKRVEGDGQFVYAINLLPNFSRGQGTSATFTETDFYNMLEDTGPGGENTKMVEKLKGKMHYYRPLLLPALKYYVAHVVKPSIIKALQQAGYHASLESIDV